MRPAIKNDLGARSTAKRQPSPQSSLPHDTLSTFATINYISIFQTHVHLRLRIAFKHFGACNLITVGVWHGWKRMAFVLIEAVEWWHYSRNKNSTIFWNGLAQVGKMVGLWYVKLLFNYYGITLILPLASNHTLSKAWDESTYSFHSQTPTASPLTFENG